MRPTDISAHAPHVRPHIRRRDRRLFFMISPRPLRELTLEEVALFRCIDGRRSVADLERMHPGAGARLLEWRAAEILELIPPLRPPARPHVVVIEPHMDDAVLSAAGRLLNRRGRCRITVLSVVRWSNYTSYMALKRDYLDVREITDLRLQEAALVARYLGAEHRCLDWTDAPIRFWPPERWSTATMETFRASPRTFVNRFPDSRDVARLAEELTREVGALAPEELWIPMGLGEHVDHRATRNACLLMLARARGRFAGLPVLMYEDVPYASDGGHATRIRTALEDGGARLVRGTEDITGVFDEKLRAISMYASQFKVAAMEPRIRALAEREAGAPGRLAEAYHRVEGRLGLPAESQLSTDWAGLAALRAELRVLLSRKKPRRMAVLALPSGHLGMWKTDRESLEAAFPGAGTHFYAAESVAWQAREGVDGEAALEVVRGRSWGWVGVFCRELPRFGTATVILTGAAYRAGFKKRLFKVLLPLRPVLFARTLSDLRGVLNEELRGS